MNLIFLFSTQVRLGTTCTFLSSEKTNHAICGFHLHVSDLFSFLLSKQQSESGVCGTHSQDVAWMAESLARFTDTLKASSLKSSARNHWTAYTFIMNFD